MASSSRVKRLSKKLGGINIAGPVSVRSVKGRQTQIGNGLSAARENHALSEVLRCQLGKTQDGCDWAMAALHPCGVSAPMQVGMPDTITAPVATPNYRGEFEIAWDPSMFDDTPSSPMSWGTQIVIPPIPEIAYLYRLRDETNSVWSNWRVVRQAGMGLPTGSYGSTTQGVTLRSFGYSKSRIVGRGTTIELNASALNNQGRIIAGQLGFANSVKSAQFVEYRTPTAATFPVFTAPLTENTISVPASSQFLVSNCPRVYQAEAKHGAYLVQKFDGPLTGYQFHDTGLQGVWNESSGSDHAQTMMADSYLALRVSDSDSDVSDWAPFTTADSMAGHLPSSVVIGSYLGAQQIHPFVSSCSDMETSVAFIQGLPVGAANTLVPTIRMKTRIFLECLSRGNAAIAPFIHPSPIRDMMAIDRVVAVMQRMDDAYPASFNDFGWILNVIASYLPDGRFKSAFQSALNNPTVKTISSIAGKLERKLLEYGFGGGNSSLGEIPGNSGLVDEDVD